MAAPISKGRMIRKDISRSLKFASLSKDSMVLFSLLIPHFSSHGKMNGSPYYIKGEVAPLIPFLTVTSIERCLKEISAKTSVKWFEHNGLTYIHSVNWLNHQELRADRLGLDDMPDYSGTTPGLLPPEVEGEGEEEREVEGAKHAAPVKPSQPPRGNKLSDEDWMQEIKSNPAYEGIDIDKLKGKMDAWCLTKDKKPTRARLLNWLNREEKPMLPSSKPASDFDFTAEADPRTLPGNCRKCGGGKKPSGDGWECKKCGDRTRERAA